MIRSKNEKKTVRKSNEGIFGTVDGLGSNGGKERGRVKWLKRRSETPKATANRTTDHKKIAKKTTTTTRERKKPRQKREPNM